MVQSSTIGGLYRKYGPDAATANNSGDYKTYGREKVTETKVVTLSALATTDSILSDVTMLPKNTWIEAVELEVIEAATSGTSLSVGLMKNTDRTTTLGAGGVVNAETTTNLTLGKVLTYDASTANHGTLIGTSITDTALITAKVAGVFGAGKVIVRVKHHPVTS